uniref:Uncharacterized protein n=1 Tax=Hyaloperonospora arabidopsidis (strain Emoy2) TaxID=559515 RepID=M4BJ19_HYAAE
MSTQSNVFSALQPEKRSKKKATDAATTATPNSMFASFVNNPSSTTAWGDDSDEEVHVPPTPHPNPPAGNQEEEEEDEESESESESEEEEEESVKPVAATDGKKAVVGPIRTLSRKEKKELEMQELDAALAALGIETDSGAAADNKPMKKEQDVDQKQVDTGSLDKKSKKKKKGKKPAKTVESETPVVGAAATGVVDIKAVMKTKSKKKKAVEPEAVRIAREEKTKGKNKGKKDKSSFNEFSI